MTRTTWKQRLAPYARTWEKLHANVEGKSVAELRALLKACRKPSQTNCGWSTYRVAHIVADMAHSEILRRAFAKRRGPTVTVAQE